MTSSYDEKQYESFSYSLTYPEHLQAMGKLFGLSSPDYSSARVLELGCASGGNIIPISYNFPKSKVVGIDLSIKQIEEGQSMVKQLELNNIELKCQSIMDFNTEDKFDYIICHGVYTWVPEDVRLKILAICKNNLEKQGVACISYNTRPSWNMVSCVRDMMQFHVRNFKSPEEKVQQARTLLNFLASGLEKDQSPYGKFLTDELKIINQAEDYYIYHEYLEEVNQPLYFHEFVSQCDKYDLTYLGDSHIPSMYPGNLKENFSKQLIEIKDVVKVGQYMDFIRNQRFRTTLVCHKDVTINRNLDVNNIQDFCISYCGRFQEKVSQDKIRSNETITFQGRGVVLTLQKPLVKACMKLLHDRFGKPILYKTLVKQSMDLAQVKDESLAIATLNQELNLMRLVLGGLVQVHVDEGIYTSVISNQPKTTPYIQAIAKARDRVPNLRHETLKLQDIERIILQYLDGSRKLSKINRSLEEKIKKGELNIADEQGQKVTKKEDIHKRVQTITLHTLENLVKKAYLIA